MNGGQSMSNEHFECEPCDGTGDFFVDKAEFLCMYPEKCDCLACDKESTSNSDWCFLEGCSITEDGVREHLPSDMKDRLVIEFKNAVAENPQVLEEE